MKVPQADDVAKLLDIPLAVSEKVSSYKEISERYDIVLREAQYYLAAVEMLGFTIRNERGFELTPIGKKYVVLPFQERKVLLMRQILALPIIREIITELITRREHSLKMSDLREIISSSSRITGKTVGRRAHTIVNWFAWLSAETNVFGANKDMIWLRLAT